jgi:hypothetical protein
MPFLAFIKPRPRTTMTEIAYDDSCLRVEQQLISDGVAYRRTLMCGIYAPDSASMLLVESDKATESHELALKPLQGGVKAADGGIAGTYEREIGEEVVLDLGIISVVHGLDTNGKSIIGGRARGGKPAKAFGIVCGIADSTPNVVPRVAPDGTREVAMAGWFWLPVAERMFMTQLSHPDTKGRGERSLMLVGLIRKLDPDAPPLDDPLY